MDIKIIEERENPFFNRKELKIEIMHTKQSTPSKASVVKELAAKYSVDESQIVIDYILTKTSVHEAIAKVKILKEKPEVKKTEEKHEAQASEAK